MPIFLCSKCGVIENTALSNYWTRDWDVEATQPVPPPLCSQCDPAIGKWHGAFERQQMPVDHVVGPDGFVYQKTDPYLKRLKEEGSTDQ